MLEREKKNLSFASLPFSAVPDQARFQWVSGAEDFICQRGGELCECVGADVRQVCNGIGADSSRDSSIPASATRGDHRGFRVPRSQRRMQSRAREQRRRERSWIKSRTQVSDWGAKGCSCQCKSFAPILVRKALVPQDHWVHDSFDKPTPEAAAGANTMYSHSRLRNALALVRVATGILFVVGGVHKISSMEFARIEFPKFLSEASNGAAVRFYADFLNSVVWQHPGTYAVLIGFTELFIGVGLVLGLAVRPISLIGIVYTVNLMLATYMAPGNDEPLWRYLDNESKELMMFFLFVVFAIGHVGENWGVGSLYHHRRRRKWEETAPKVESENARSGTKSKNWQVR